MNIAKRTAVAVTVAAIAAGAGAAFADAGATAAATNSAGVASGNTVQAPVHGPVNAGGLTVDVVGALNPAFGNQATNG
ncbi:chaplin [Streptomyces collinus]|uniref:chaplin n=1 Tax=Streptomyces collinus TaxID=42684 RepID=UPI00294289CD|nr:chaplin [Streptomyces collinus]